ncbi:flagellar biosynthesis anti-sigma factor FlgM [Acidilutibacter cellobiosedens]|uniref:Flagellar biosynthesis anti-sigma factor FlgM n=1 Tax=Acidilutibacter cellobiosedens TaxID=2507161 RepID=A0A410Q9L4_9FIRM|nr:flagellar biosynthesis anti-sigma factor FlgM [Acidilutibacter cellobiosedens]QAT60685.1 flagellar biosynthesis anti-sigma factor FlgM [Acidilutibacter cellobiosedens]
MKINGINKTLEVYENIEIKRSNDIRGISKKDELKLSDKAMDYGIALKKLKDVPEIRMDKVKKIQDEIKTGVYKLDGEKIVEKMFQEANFEKRI